MHIPGTSDYAIGFHYPDAYVRATEQGLPDVRPWAFLDFAFAVDYAGRLKQRYPQRDLFPFARRIDCDEIACWEIGDGERVFVVHDFTTPGWEDCGWCDDFDDWLRTVTAVN